MYFSIKMLKCQILPVWLTYSQKPLSCHSHGGVHRPLLGHLCEWVEVGHHPGEDLRSIAAGEDVEKGEEGDGQEDEYEVPHNQG